MREGIKTPEERKTLNEITFLTDGRTDNDIFRGRFLPIKSELTHNFDENVDCSDAKCVLAVVQRVDVAYQVQYRLPSIKVCVLFIAK